MDKRGVFILGLSATLYILISYFTLRFESGLLLTEFSFVFICYLTFSYLSEEYQAKYLVLGAIILRLILVFAIPNLSEDVYRFIWDGKLWLQGIDAYQYLPEFLIENNSNIVDEELYKHLNSPGYFTIYPPLNQLIFIGSSIFNGLYNSILFIKLTIILAEAFTLLGLYKLWKGHFISKRAFALYSFNPLVILELSGNLHFEAFVICFLVWTVYFFLKKESLRSGLMMGLAIGFKIIPVILLASFFRKYKFRKYTFFILTALITAMVSFSPLLGTHVFSGISESAQLYFQNFEFNASIYYIIRAIGFHFYGYNVIQTAGPFIAFTGIFGICIYNILAKRNVIIWERMLFSWFIYCLFATTIHPWYIIPMVLFGSLSSYNFPILWSFLIFFTYIGYTATGFHENLMVTAIEYILVISFAVFEIYKKYTKHDDKAFDEN